MGGDDWLLVYVVVASVALGGSHVLGLEGLI